MHVLNFCVGSRSSKSNILPPSNLFINASNEIHVDLRAVLTFRIRRRYGGTQFRYNGVQNELLNRFSGHTAITQILIVTLRPNDYLNFQLTNTRLLLYVIYVSNLVSGGVIWPSEVTHIANRLMHVCFLIHFPRRLLQRKSERSI